MFQQLSLFSIIMTVCHKYCDTQFEISISPTLSISISAIIIVLATY